ncbi:MAG: hypothetical protein RLZZ126_1639 [Pseudomonadota bacterium]|jgi:uncharacterized protein
MTIEEALRLNSHVLWLGFGVSFLFGMVAQRTHFCTMGAVSDVVNMGDWSRARQWALAAGLGMIGFALLAATGQIDPTQTLYASTRWMWLSASVGGAMFGFGMVLASGCGSKTLVRIGAGNLKSVVVFLALAVAAFATLKGITAVARVATVDRVAVELTQGANLAQWLALGGKDAASWWLLPGGLLGGVLVLWAVLGRGFRTADNLLAGIGIGALLVLAWWVSGHVGHLAEHPETLQRAYLGTSSGRMEALSFVAPIAHSIDWLMFFSDKSKTLTLGVVSVLGVVAGSFVWARLSGSFRWEGFANVEDLANHLLGGGLMGVGGVTAMGCTIGQGLSGVSTLSLTSFVAVAAIIAGACAAFRYQMWRLERMA